MMQHNKRIKIFSTDPDHRFSYKGENYYAQVDGKNVGDNKTMFYKTKDEAMKVALEYCAHVPANEATQ